MKRRLMMIALILLLSVRAVPAYAETFKGEDGWYVTFTADEEVVSNFSTKQMADSISELQPGDEITFTLKVTNEHPETVDWYMSNEVIHSLEDRKDIAEGGAYTYILTYTPAGGKPHDLYSSKAVGGDEINSNGEEGLHKATDALKDYIYLDTHENGKTGVITLYVALDGETQRNAYQNTEGDLLMRFAVELRSGRQVKTGDPTDMLPYYIMMFVSGAVLFAGGFAGLKLRRARRKKEDRA